MSDKPSVRGVSKPYNGYQIVVLEDPTTHAVIGYDVPLVASTPLGYRTEDDARRAIDKHILDVIAELKTHPLGGSMM